MMITKSVWHEPPRSHWHSCLAYSRKKTNKDMWPFSLSFAMNLEDWVVTASFGLDHMACRAESALTDCATDHSYQPSITGMHSNCRHPLNERLHCFISFLFLAGNGRWRCNWSLPGTDWRPTAQLICLPLLKHLSCFIGCYFYIYILISDEITLAYSLVWHVWLTAERGGVG